MDNSFPTFTEPEPEPGSSDGLIVAPVAVLAGRPAQAQLARIGLLGIAAAALIAAAILVVGTGASPTGTLAADTDTGSDGGSVSTLNGGGPDGPGGHGFGRGFGGVEITAINGSSISLETADGWTRTITVDSGTTYSRSGDTIALGDLAVGDQVAFRQTLEDDGTFTIDSVAVIPPHAGGEVTAVSGSTITVTRRDDTTTTINVDSATEYTVNGEDAALADVKVGMFLVAEGTENSDGSLDATTVRAGDAGDFRGPGGKGGHRFGFGPDGNDSPDATTAPTATGAAG
ncbi:MAG TPA: DUF5666 domain-containing protein [Candidatus Limnocylindria bacterium]|nr:DUF5666 domain-containing protein [Candidatus Limnocylindria bacterium]